MAANATSLEQQIIDWSSAVQTASATSEQAVELLDHVDTLLGEPATNTGDDSIPSTAQHAWLEITGRPSYLELLPDDDTRLRWAEVANRVIDVSGYTLETMLDARVAEQPSHPLFEELKAGESLRWNYTQVRRRVRAIAAVFLRDSGTVVPRVALQVENSVDGACCDLACLLHDILVTPLNVHFDIDELAWILDRLSISIVVTDRDDRLRKLEEVRKRVSKPFRIYVINMERDRVEGRAQLLAETISRLSREDVDGILANRPRFGLHEICTVMFTSGSTGRPKGVAFSQYNLVTKRFDRAAALPTVGREEVLLCFLPLFHTFGRYLEMLGMLFWRGTYVFVGNPSSEALIAGLSRVKPTGLISIPLRWAQIRDRALEKMEALLTSDEKLEAFREVVGPNLRWGLSAAGYLEPKAFRFFHAHGVALCSGFGMTEATGGITMNPPGDYHDNTVGKPLPGMRISIRDNGEMLIAGAYVARYLKENGEGLELEPGIEADGEEWLPTGDIFKRLADGHLTIVDRIKDIYKNNRGQTVAPRRVEQRFANVPGIKRTFLVGDHRSYNVLLIVPDMDDPVLSDSPTPSNVHDYFRQIVTVANEDLAPYERVVNFALLERDFDLDQGELTAKGSFRRKQIEENFAEQIAALYESSVVVLKAGGVAVKLPRWLFRDLGILESDIRADALAVDAHGGTGLLLSNSQHNTTLRVRWGLRPGWMQVGDLSYPCKTDEIDLGLFARQPRLWVGNPSLIAFAPCKEGWDVPIPNTLSVQATLPTHPADPAPEQASPLHLSDVQLLDLNRDVYTALFGDVEDALTTLAHIQEHLIAFDDRLGSVARLRVTALATHPSERLRCTAYRILLLDEPMLDYSRSFPAFVQSGLSFLNEESIKQISKAGFEHRRLAALRQRLYSYRTHLSWPAQPVVQRQFKNVFRLLVNFVRFNPEFYKSVRAELASWILHRQDPTLVRFAEMMLDQLVSWFEGRLVDQSASVPESLLEAMIVFDEDLDDPTRENLQDLLLYTTFLKQSVMLTFHEEDFDLDHVPAGGIWVSRLHIRGTFSFYRVSVNTISGRHFDLLVVLRDDMNVRAVMDTNHWMMTIGGHPHGQRVLPRFGCIRPELAAMSLEFVNELTAWDKIREFAGATHPNSEGHRSTEWRRIFVTAMAAFFRAWRYSGRRIIPGTLSPVNVVVPELDFRQEALILSLNGWVEYDGPLSLFRPMQANFFRKTAALYPLTNHLIDENWLFDACVEGLGLQEGEALLRDFADTLSQKEIHPFSQEFVRQLDAYLDGLHNHWYVPLPVHNAIHRYHSWTRLNPNTTTRARAELLEGLISMYMLHRQGEQARYHLYRYTYFEHASEEVCAAFDALLDALFSDPNLHATQRVELSDLQAALDDPNDQEVFSRLVFPRAQRALPLEVFTVGERGRKQVVVRTHLIDNHGERYDVREPIEPEEIGTLYRLFYQERFPKTVSEMDRHLVVTDTTDRVVGGLTFKVQDDDVVHMDGLVTSGPLQGRGLATALLEDFVTRMASRGVRVLKTDFLMRDFCERREFCVDRNWGGLVRFIGQEEDVATNGDLYALDD